MARRRAQFKSRTNSYLAALSCPRKCNCQTCFRVEPPTLTSMNCMFQIRWFQILHQRKACRSLLTTKLSDLLHRVELKSRRSWWQGKHRKLNSYSKLQPLRRIYKRVLADKALWHRWVSQRTQKERSPATRSTQCFRLIKSTASKSKSKRTEVSPVLIWQRTQIWNAKCPSRSSLLRKSSHKMQTNC